MLRSRKAWLKVVRLAGYPRGKKRGRQGGNVVVKEHKDGHESELH